MWKFAFVCQNSNTKGAKRTIKDNKSGKSIDKMVIAANVNKNGFNENKNLYFPHSLPHLSYFIKFYSFDFRLWLDNRR